MKSVSSSKISLFFVADFNLMHRRMIIYDRHYYPHKIVRNDAIPRQPPRPQVPPGWPPPALTGAVCPLPTHATWISLILFPVPSVCVDWGQSVVRQGILTLSWETILGSTATATGLKILSRYNSSFEADEWWDPQNYYWALYISCVKLGGQRVTGVKLYNNLLMLA